MSNKKALAAYQRTDIIKCEERRHKKTIRQLYIYWNKLFLKMAKEDK